MKFFFALLAAFASCTAFATGMAARESAPLEPVATKVDLSEEAPPFDGSVGTGLTFVQIGAELNYWVTDWFGVVFAF